MRVFIAGGTGTIGRHLVTLLLEGGHEVVALGRTVEKARDLEASGAKVVLADALDKERLNAAIEEARPEVVIHQLTSLTGVANFKRMDDDFAVTNRLRTEATDALLAAARGVGAQRFIAQSFCGWPFARTGGPIKTEEDPLDPQPPTGFRQTLGAIRHLEEAVVGAADLEGVVLRYGFLYGPGTSIAKDGAIVELVRQRQFPVVGGGAGVWSFTHVEDAAQATAAAVTKGAAGVYNVVDDEPAEVSAWLPQLADALGAKPPRKVPAWLARFVLGEGGISMMTQVRGGSNAKAKRDLAWEPAYPSWRQGFRDGLG